MSGDSVVHDGKDEFDRRTERAEFGTSTEAGREESESRATWLC